MKYLIPVLILGILVLAACSKEVAQPTNPTTPTEGQQSPTAEPVQAIDDGLQDSADLINNTTQDELDQDVDNTQKALEDW
ncbi:MAG: hypothetical protein ABIA93_05560 [Candidatus Woesearchaeota archaeon]